METIAISALLIVAARWLIALFNLTTGEPRKVNAELPKGEISVLIPARNEAKTLPGLLQNLQQCQYLIGEIIIYNDQSEDETAATANLWARHDPRIRVINGGELPEGWKGKNHACHQLAGEAKGKYLLFLDADVKTDKKAIELALTNLTNHNLTLFSFFPVQEMDTLGEWLLVAQVNVILTSLLPMTISTNIPGKLLSAANGQFMMFGAETYHRHQFHKKLKHMAVEDVAIAQYIKQSGMKMRTALAPKGLTCRMYHNYHEALYGLARSARFFFGGSIFAGWVYVAFSLFGWVPVLWALTPIWLIVYFLLSVMMRIFVALAGHQSVLKNLVLMPFQQIALFHLLIETTKQLITGKTIWKGRTI